ncbi:hypothetical protein ACFFGT_12020 [Mucilaginibacter angelicae]|uniref:FAD assembly factor SdhE n=1 Tax=Mucilaginibacter angelicae TaxID=869718 RepID=A0ABV6L647_9SPHI
MDSIRLRMLFERYAVQIIDETELAELMAYISNAADEDLYALLWEQWQSAECRPVFNEIRRQRMLNNILAAMKPAAGEV